MKNVPLLAVCACALLLAACGGGASRSATASSTPAPAAAPSADIAYAEVEHDGRLYVIGNAETLAAFKQTHHLPYTRTLIGDGPKGMTVVIEIDKSNEAYNAALLAAYRARHPYYREAKHDGRLYVIGSSDSMAAFGSSGHLPYCKTFIGRGPHRETVIFEIQKDEPDLLPRLVAEFNQRNGTALSL